MTCEIAVMNKLGVALAADSAVTIGEGEKIYHNAEKLFQIRSDTPVGIMIYGSAEIMGMPWEIVINSFAQHRDQRRLDRVEQYAQEFFRFLEASALLFPQDVQVDWFRMFVRDYWEEVLVKPLLSKIKKDRATSGRAASDILTAVIADDHASWQQTETVEDLGSSYGEKVVHEYGSVLDELEKELFAEYPLSRNARAGLRTIVKLMHTQRWSHPLQSGVVFAGMGEAEPFPRLLDYRVGLIAAGRLAFWKSTEACVGREDPAWVVPLAQAEMVEMFYRGILPELDRKLDGIVSRCFSREGSKRGQKLASREVESLQKAFRKAVEDEVSVVQKPLISAVDALPRSDLARIAEALVSLTALRRRVSVEQQETVGGAIDVALLSRADGFAWVKRNAVVSMTSSMD